MDPTVIQTTTHTKRVALTGPEPITLDDLAKLTSQAYELGIAGNTPITMLAPTFAGVLGVREPLRTIAVEETS